MVSTPGEVLSYFKELTLAVFWWRFANFPTKNHRDIQSIVTKQYITYITYQKLNQKQIPTKMTLANLV